MFQSRAGSAGTLGSHSRFLDSANGCSHACQGPGLGHCKLPSEPSHNGFTRFRRVIIIVKQAKHWRGHPKRPRETAGSYCGNASGAGAGRYTQSYTGGERNVGLPWWAPFDQCLSWEVKWIRSRAHSLMLLLCLLRCNRTFSRTCRHFQVLVWRPSYSLPSECYFHLALHTRSNATLMLDARWFGPRGVRGGRPGRL